MVPTEIYGFGLKITASGDSPIRSDMKIGVRKRIKIPEAAQHPLNSVNGQTAGHALEVSAIEVEEASFKR